MIWDTVSDQNGAAEQSEVGTENISLLNIYQINVNIKKIDILFSSTQVQ